MKLILTLVALTAFFGGQIIGAEKKPLKVFILAGQSNMEGHGQGLRRGHARDDENRMTTNPLRPSRLCGANLSVGTAKAGWAQSLFERENVSHERHQLFL